MQIFIETYKINLFQLVFNYKIYSFTYSITTRLSIEMSAFFFNLDSLKHYKVLSISFNQSLEYFYSFWLVIMFLMPFFLFIL